MSRALARFDAALIKGASMVNMFGRMTNGGATERDVWDGSVEKDAYEFLTQAKQLSVVSDNAGDGPAGAGCKSITVVGLDVDLCPIQEVIELNGQTPVNSQQEFFRVNRTICREAGSTSTEFRNLGRISIGTADTVFTDGAFTSGDLLDQISPGFGVSYSSVFTVPKGMLAYPVLDRSQINNTSAFEVFFKVKRPGQMWIVVDINLSDITSPIENIQPLVDTGIFWPAGTDMKASAAIVIGGGTTKLYAAYVLALIPTDEAA